jgi:hypothetical protein
MLRTAARMSRARIDEARCTYDKLTQVVLFETRMSVQVQTGVMGLLRRLFGGGRPDQGPPGGGDPSHVGFSPTQPSGGNTPLAGSETLEVVGESFHQDNLWRLVGGKTTEPVREEIQAVLLAETNNRHDANAISVWIDDLHVGYLSRENAAAYRPGLLRLQTRRGRVALSGVIVGGGERDHGLGFLGVFLSHDRADFGLAPLTPLSLTLRGRIRTGLSEARATDEDDDSYDLSWLSRLPSDNIAAIARLRRMLQHDGNLIDRHFMFRELERRLYRSRDAFRSALDEYDDVCQEHDAEMDRTREALVMKFGTVPILETYAQMTIRQQKAKNWIEALRWAERGLALYGDRAERPEAVEDLRRRATDCRGRLAAINARPTVVRTQRNPPAPDAVETLTCEGCGKAFERLIVRGRKPKQCPACRQRTGSG